ncbi:MAG: CHAD domain-containing protein [Sphingobium sp.]
METEFEIKLNLDGPEQADALAHMLDLGPPETQRLSAVYFDTPDLRLAERGCSLRIRRNGRRRIQTIKLAGGASVGAFARREWEQVVRSNAPVLGSDSPVRAILGDDVARLEPRFQVETLRRCWTIAYEGASIELAADRATARAGDAAVSFTEVELELKRGDQAALFALAGRVGKLVPVRLGMLSKVERARRLAKPHAGPDKERLVRLLPDMTAEDAFRAIGHVCLRHYRLNEQRLIAGDDASALHQARVALRRFRSALTAFRPIIKGDTARRLNSDLRWLARQLASARNIDVAMPRVSDPRVLRTLKKARSVAYDDARRAMNSALTRELMLDLAEWFSVGDWTQSRKKARHAPAGEFGATAIDRLHRRLLKQSAAIAGPDDTDDTGGRERHELRKTAKKLRYTVEFFALLFDDGKRRKARIRYLAALEELQDHLGALNDAATMETLFEGLGLDPALADLQVTETGMRAFHLLQAEQVMNLLKEAKRFWK